MTFLHGVGLFTAVCALTVAAAVLPRPLGFACVAVLGMLWLWTLEGER